MSFTSRLSSSPGLQHDYDWLVSSSAPSGSQWRDGQASPGRTRAGLRYSLQRGFDPHVLSDVLSEEGEERSERSSSIMQSSPRPYPFVAAQAHNRGAPSGLARAARGLLLGADAPPAAPRLIAPYRRRTAYGSLPSRQEGTASVPHSFDIEPSQLRPAASADAPGSLFPAHDIDPSANVPSQEDIENTLEGISRSDVAQSGLARASGVTPKDVARWKKNGQSKHLLPTPVAPDEPPQLDEQTSLLPHDSSVAADTESGDNFTIPSPWTEAKTLVRYSLPITGTHLLEMSLSITVFSLGHLGTVELAAASLASLTGNVTGFSLISGLVSALDSLLPSAFASDRPWTVGVWTQRMAVLLGMLLVPIALLWFEAEVLLLAMKQEPRVAHLASQYLRVLIPALPAYAGFETCRRYLQAQKLFVAPTIAVGIAGAINIPLNILLVLGPKPIGIGFLGAAISSLVCYWIMFGIALIQCALAPRNTWAGLTKAALDIKGLKSLWNLGIASLAAMAAEWWAFECTGLLTSYLGTTWLAAQSVLLVTSMATFQIPAALSVATAVRVGNLLGANASKHAHVAARVAMISSLIAGVANMILLTGARNYWGLMFTTDDKVISIIRNTLPYLAAFQVADSLIVVNGGILRSSGKQSISAYLNVVSYYVFGIPTSIYLMKLGWQLAGIWLGLTLGLVVGALGSTMVIVRINWEKEALKSQERVSAAATSDESVDGPLAVPDTQAPPPPGKPTSSQLPTPATATPNPTAGPQ